MQEFYVLENVVNFDISTGLDGFQIAEDDEIQRSVDNKPVIRESDNTPIERQ